MICVCLWLCQAVDRKHSDMCVSMAVSGWDSSGTILADLCGGGFIQPTLLSSGVFMLIRFRSDHANTASGFRLQYQTTNLPCECVGCVCVCLGREGGVGRRRRVERDVCVFDRGEGGWGQ